MEQFKFTNRQLYVIDILKNQTFSQKNIATMYQGAIMVKDIKENPDSIHQAAHSLRELTKYMTEHLAVSKEGKQRVHKEQMKLFLDDFDPLGGVNSEAAIEQWHSLHKYFVMLCHHHSDTSPPDKFEEKLYLLENIILAIQGPISVPISELDKLIEIFNPTMDDLDKAISLIKNLSSKEYFFKKLKHPNWLELLNSKELYNSVPKRGERYVESQFLLKVAEQKSDLVLEIMKRNEDTDHPGAIVNYIRCLIQMPVESIKQMINPIKKWIKSEPNYSPQLFYNTIDLVNKLIEENAKLEIIELLNPLFAIKEKILEHDKQLEQKIKDSIEKRYESGEFKEMGYSNLFQDDIHDTLQEEFETYTYEGLINRLSLNFITNYPLEALKLFLKKLFIAIKIFLKPNDKTYDDHSLIWRKNLNEIPISKKFRTVLIDVIIKIINYIGNNEIEEISLVILELQKYNYLIFKRLEFLTYNNFPELPIELIKKIIIKEVDFGKIDENFEMYKNFEMFFDKYPSEIQQSYLKYVRKGIKKSLTKILKKSNRNKNFPKLNNEGINNYIRKEQMKKLKPIKSYVVAEFLSKLGIDVKDFNKIDPFIEDNVVFGTESPVSLEEFSTIEEVNTFLLNYDANKSFEFDKIGLGREIESDVVNRPDDYINLLEHLLEQPTLHKYFPFMIDGIKKALKGNQDLDYAKLFVIFLELLDEKFRINDEALFFKQDINRDIKKSIADLFHENLKNDIISLEHKENIWKLIQKLLNVKDLNKETELKAIETQRMPRDMSLNSVMGISVNLIFDYISWIIKSDEEKYKLEKNKLNKYFPEVLEILDTLLLEPLYTTRYVIARYFYYLCYLDIEWASNQFPVIFTTNGEELDFFEAAWSGFLDHNRVVLKYFNILRPAYMYALSLLNEDFKIIPYSKESFANHLIILYLNQLEDLDDQDSLIFKFFKEAAGDYRKSAIRNIGNFLSKNQTIDDFEEKKQRFKKLLDHRFKEYYKGNVNDYETEFNGYIYFFINSIFEEDWTINRLLDLLKILNSKFEGRWYVIDILQDHVRMFPFKVIECLSLVLKHEVKDDYIIYEEKYKQVLQELIDLDNQDVTEKVHELVDFLFRRNLHNFRDLLVNSDKRAEEDDYSF